MSAGEPVGVEISRLTYHYPDGTPALDGLDLRVAPGERVALLGPNGAGKSTLLLHLAGLLPERRRYLHAHGAHDHPHRHGSSGRIAIGGLELTPASLAAIRERVGIVFEDPDDQLFGLTIGEDVAFGPTSRRWPEAETTAAVSRALAAVGLTGFEERAPHHLSAGEKRRACLAGVLVSSPGLLLLDEPSSSLDPRGRRELAGLLAGLPATLFVATHDMEFARQLCRRALIVDQGRVQADGTIDEILADGERLRRHGLA